MSVHFICVACNGVIPCDYIVDALGRRHYRLGQRVCTPCRDAPRSPDPRQRELWELRASNVREAGLENLADAVQRFHAARRAVVRAAQVEVDAAEKVWEHLLCNE